MTLVSFHQENKITRYAFRSYNQRYLRFEKCSPNSIRRTFFEYIRNI